MNSSQPSSGFRQINPHSAGFAQGFLLSAPTACRFVATYATPGADGASDFEAAFDRLSASLSSYGLSLSDTVAMTVMLSRTQDTARFRQTRIERLGGRLPASTLVHVEGFDGPERTACIEITAASGPIPTFASRLYDLLRQMSESKDH